VVRIECAGQTEGGTCPLGIRRGELVRAGRGSSTEDLEGSLLIAQGLRRTADPPQVFADVREINDHFDGVASVLGLARTAAYGGFYPIKRLFDAGKIAYGWQTFAWSGGQWDPRAQLRQVRNGVTIAGADCDIDEAQVQDFGQWGFAGAPADDVTTGMAPDFDGDDRGDLVGTGTDGTMTAYLNLGTPGHPSFGNQRSIGVGWNGITRIAVVDADNDGKRDLLGVWGDGTMTAYLNTSAPAMIGFGNPQNIGTGWNNITWIATVH
jgi:hypothetical protein